jgi:CHAT domain-containing protein
VDFYRRATAGADRSDALREAQRAALADPARAHPFFWAAFILSGNDGPLTNSSRQ